MNGINESNGNILGMLDTTKPQEKHLLDNVSLMTTISPIPSQNNSLQPPSGGRDSEDGGKFLGRIRDKLTGGAITEEHETNVSTLTAFEDQLHEHLNETGTTESSAPATTEVGNAKVMYGFDLSPVHSLEKKKPLDTNQGTLETETSQANSTANIDNFFKTTGSVSLPAPNFMQAKVASPRHLRSEKSGVNEDTETVMSQVFSSQDVTASINGERRVSLITPDHSKQGKNIYSNTKKETRFKGTTGHNIKTKVNTRRIEDGNAQNYEAHSRVSKQNNKKSSFANKGKGSTPKTTPVKRTVNIVTPKSPKQRQSAIKVTPRIKNSSKTHSKRRLSPSKDRQPATSKGKLQSDTKLVIDSTAFSETDFSVTDASMHLISSSPDQRKIELMPRLSAGIHSPDEEILKFRSHIKEMQEELKAANLIVEDAMKENNDLKNEMDILKKDNFVLKSKTEQLLIKQDSKRMDAVEKTDKSKYGENLSKLELEISEQDKLILGYQRENERIYAEMKNIKQDGKELELAMYKENLKLKSEISKLRETVERDENIIESLKDQKKQTRNAANDISITDMDGDLSLKKRVAFLESGLRTEEGFRMKAEASLKKMTQERDDAEKQLRIYECKTDEKQEKLIKEHKIEIENLRSQLMDARRSLLDKDDVFTIRDITNTPPSKSLLSHFQKRVHKLEGDLEKRDTTSSEAVKMLKEQYDSVKTKYEERIDNLEMQIKRFRENTHQNSDSPIKQNNKAIEKKLADALSKLQSLSVSREKERDVLMEKIQSLQQNKPSTSPKRQISTPTTPNAVVAWKKKCGAKDMEIEKLRELLQKAFDDLAIRREKRGRSRSREKRKNNPQKSSYNPGAFEAEGYTGLMKENTDLKTKLEGMELELRHNKVTNEALIAKLEQEAKTLRSAYENGTSTTNQQNLDTVASRYDENHVLMMQQQILALEQELENCQKQVLFLENESKESSVAKIREHALQIQVQQLVGELHQMHSSSPSASTRKVAALENKIRVLEEEFRLKEETFKNALISNSSSILQSEMSKLQEQLLNKNKELTRFRLELDSILLVLREVQSQGIKIPLPQYLQSIF